jgi:hypothetical protein
MQAEMSPKEPCVDDETVGGRYCGGRVRRAAPISWWGAGRSWTGDEPICTAAARGGNGRGWPRAN